jgi:hypothetical protein
MNNASAAHPLASGDNSMTLESNIQEPCQKIVEHCLEQLIAMLSPPEKSALDSYFAKLASEALGSAATVNPIESADKSGGPRLGARADTPFTEAFSEYLRLSGMSQDDWVAEVLKKTANPVLLIDMLQLLSMADRWSAIVTGLDWDYGEEFTLSVMASRQKLWRIDHILNGKVLMLPTPLEVLRGDS